MLLIITDGEITDMEDTKEAIVLVCINFRWRRVFNPCLTHVSWPGTGVRPAHVHHHHRRRSSRLLWFVDVVDWSQCESVSLSLCYAAMVSLDGDDGGGLKSRGRAVVRDIVQVRLFRPCQVPSPDLLTTFKIRVIIAMHSLVS